MTTPATATGSTADTAADRIAAAVLACPAVAGLHGGRFGEVATYLPGRKVPGIRQDGHHVTVHVVGRYPTPVTEVGAQVRAAVTAALAGAVPPVVDITVEDYLDPPLFRSDLS